MRKLLLGVSLAFGTALAAAGQQQAPQLPQPRLYALFPAGGKAGASVEVRLSGGAELERVDRLVFSHAGIRSKQVELPADRFYPQPRPVEGRFVVSVGADVPPGVYEVRAAGPYGVSNARRFAVDLREEVLEKEPNNDAATAQAMPFGSVVNGVTEAQGFDVYQVALKKGQRLIAVVQALALDSRAQLSLEVLDPAGRSRGRVVGTRTSDPMADVTAEADGAHLLRVHDLTFRGGDEYGYRLTAGSGPWIDFVDPPVVKAGGETEVTVYGRGLPGGSPAEGLSIEGRPLEKRAVKVAPPAEARSGEAFFFPGEASADVFAWRLEGSNPVRLMSVDGAATPESEPNDDPAKAPKIQIPAQVVGRLQARGDRDWFAFDAKKGEKLWIEVVSQRLGRPTDPVFVVQDAAGKDLLESDDPGPAGQQRQRNNDQFRRLRLTADDPAALWTAPADGSYRLLVRDLYSGAQGDPRFFYVLRVRPARPDFSLVAFPVETFAGDNRISPWSCVLRRGGTSQIRVHAFRHEGYEGPILLEAEGLPAGVSSRSVVMAGDSTSDEILFQAAADAPAFGGSVRIVGHGQADGREIARAVRSAEIVYPVTDQNQQTLLPRVTDRIALAVDAERTVPLAAKADDGGKPVRTARSGKLKVPVKLVKQADFKDIEKAQVKLTPVGLPGQGNNRPVTVKELTLDLTKPDGVLEIDVTDKAPLGPMTFFLAGEVQVPYLHEAGRVKALDEERKRIEQVTKELAAEIKAAGDARAKAEQDLKKAQEALDAAKKKVPADPSIKEAEEKVKAAEDAKNKAVAAETQLKDMVKNSDAMMKKLADDSKKAGDAAKEKKVRMWVATLPITVDIAAAPLSLKLPAEKPVVRADGKVEVEIELVREFGFDGEVKLELGAPGASKLTLAASAVAAKDQAKVKLALAAAKDAPAGEVTATLKASIAWNGKTVPFEQPFPVRVEKAEPERKADAKP
jgi:flagellar motor protein MotB